MKKALALVLSGLVGLSISAVASAGEPENVMVVKASDKIVTEGSSAHMRMDKSYLLTVESGLAVGAIPTSGGTAGYYLDRNSILQVNYVSGKLDFLGTIVRVKSGGIHYKHFFGNSFYLRGGAGYRELQAEYYSWLFTKSAPKEVGISRSVVADLAIGNQWQWQNFTLGCDWVGAMIPIADAGSRFSTEGYSDADKKRATEDWDSLQKITSSQLLRFYIGASF